MGNSYLAVQEYSPSENVNHKKCIWCKSDVVKNRAHILSRKLTNTTHPSTVLTLSVCEKCNNRLGQTEEWILRNTHIGWMRFFLYFSPNVKSSSVSLPSYFFSPNCNEWLIYYIKNGRQIIPTQLLASKDGVDFAAFINENELDPYAALRSLLEKIQIGNYSIYTNPRLHDSFSDRFLVGKDNIYLIVKEESSISAIVSIIKSTGFQRIQLDDFTKLQAGISHKRINHFRWSKENWSKFCAKICLECLSLFEGPEFCLDQTFDMVRRWVMQGPSKKSHEIIFDENGPITDKDMPTPIFLDLSRLQNAPRHRKLVLGHCDIGMHIVLVFEVSGWIYASSSISGLPPSLFILGGPDIHLKDFYSLVYYEEEDKFSFYRLAYDISKPTVPIFLSDELTADILETYKLKSHFM